MPLDFKDYRPRLLGLPPKPFQFGFESEFGDATRLFSYYAPTAEVPAGEDTNASLRAFCLSLPHGDKRTVLEKKAEGAPDFLPPGLHRDDTGNVEIVMGPFEDAARFRAEVEWVNENLGVGSLQAMVSLPPADFFGPAETGAQEVLGWLNFFNELDLLERMERGCRRFEKDSSREPLQSFLHPYLGPMIAVRHRLLKKFLRENAKGEMLNPEDLIRPARRDHSFKFVGSTAYRPDIAAPARFCLEVRDTHRDPELLFNRIARIQFYWSRPRDKFAAFAEIPPFDSAAAFEELPPNVRAWLQSIAPAKAPAVVREFEKALFTYEVFRNFSYPWRNWGPWAEILGVDLQQVKGARDACLARLERAMQNGEGRLGAQGAIVPFARESGLLEGMLAFEHKLMEGR